MKALPPLLLAALSGVAVGCGASDDAGARLDAPAVEPPPAPSIALCDRLEGAEPAAIDPAVQLSRAYALRRWFGVAARGRTVNDALEQAAGTTDALGALTRSTEACVVPSGAPLPEAAVERIGDVAIVRPGRGAPIAIPADARAVAVDLRGLASGSALEDALAALATSVLSGEHAWPAEERMHCAGLPDEMFNPEASVYRCSVATGAAWPKTVGTAPARPLAVLTGPRLAPEAALFAASLRMSGKAWIVGEDVLTEVAETTAAPGPERTAYVRTHVLRDGATVLPDVVAADQRTSDPTPWLRSLPQRGGPPALDGGIVERATGVSVPVAAPATDWRAELGARRAAIVAAHAAVRTFFPYFRVVPDTWDAAFLDAWRAADAAATPRQQQALLETLGAALEDGHQFVSSTNAEAAPRRFAALEVDVLAGEPIVMRSGVPGIVPGDRIVSVDGEPAKSRMDQARLRTSGSPGRRDLGAANALVRLDAAATYVVERAAGGMQTVQVAASATPLRLVDRAAGALGDLGAPDTYYVSLADAALRGRDVLAIAAEAKSHRAIVLDMRGYPGAEVYTILTSLLPAQTRSCEMRIPTIGRRGEVARDSLIQRVGDFGFGDGAPFAGPMAMLIGPATQSAAEHIAFFFANGKHAKLVGRPTSGANGNITGASLPGGFFFSFTGMEVRHLDGARFHGLGLQPDVPVEPVRADVAAGKDTVLVKAIEALAD